MVVVETREQSSADGAAFHVPLPSPDSENYSIDALQPNDPLRELWPLLNPEQQVFALAIRRAGDAGIDRIGIEEAVRKSPVRPVTAMDTLRRQICAIVRDHPAVHTTVDLQVFLGKSARGMRPRLRFHYLVPPATNERAVNNGISETTRPEIVIYERGQDKTSFKDFFATYQDLIYRYTHRLMGNPEDASDFTQEAFLRAWRSWYSFDGKNPQAWIYRIAKNACLDELRSRRLIHWLPWESFAADFHPAQIARDDPLKEVLQSEEQRQVQAVLDRMNPRYRTVLVLREYQNLSYAEIAEATGKSVESTKTALFRAREAFRAKYRRMHGRDLTTAAA